MAKVNKKEFEGFKDTEMTLIDGRVVTIGQYFTNNDFFPSKDKKDVFVKYEGLSRVVRELFFIKDYVPNIVQCPAKNNDWCATLNVEYTILAKTENASDIRIGATADCRATITTQGFGLYTTALAETRAKARAFRDILGLPMCSVEEVSDEADVIDKTLDDPIEAQQVMLIEKKFFQQMNKTIKDVSEIIERKVSTLDELSKGEGGKIIKAITESIPK